MIGGYTQNWFDVKPNSITLISVLLECAHLSSQKQCNFIHGYIFKSGYLVTITTLIDTYANYNGLAVACQSISCLEKLFYHEVQ